MKPPNQLKQKPKKASSSSLRPTSSPKQAPSSDAITIPAGSTLVRPWEHGGKPFGLRKIVVPVDFSKAGQAAIDYAASLATHFKAGMILIHVIQRVYRADEGSYIQISTRRMRQRVTKDLRTLKMRLPAALEIQIEVQEGSAFDEIVTMAREANADLIIMGTHGYTGMRHALLGSTAERVVQHASCPVLVVPSGVHEGSV
jgi:universal stress protein A